MSEAISKTEIDDLLSSIRALVADKSDTRGIVQITASSKSEEPSKLLLTEDFMVTEEAVPAQEEDVATTLQSKIARLETLIAEANLQFEPEAAGDGALAGARFSDAPAWHGEIEDVMPEVGNVHPLFQAEEMVAEESEPEVTEVSIETELSADEDQELRTFISAMIRQELRGSLGQDISDRLRLLVREEIARALTEAK
jgi:hypothetical protein